MRISNLNMKQKDFVLLLGSSCIVVVAWIIFSFINKTVTSTLDKTLTQTVKPIAGSFDTETLQRVRERQQVVPDYSLTTQTASATAQVTPTPRAVTPTPTPLTSEVTATQSAEVLL